MAVFSVRHRRALEDGKLQLELSPRLRGRLWRAMQSENYSWSETDETNWNHQTDVLSELPARLLNVTGDSSLQINFKKVNLETFVRKAAAKRVCDAIEIFVEFDGDAAKSFNIVLEEEDSALRLLQGQVVKLDAGLLAGMTERTFELFDRSGFEGAARELRDAQDDLMDGDVRGAVHVAGSAFESVAKGLLGGADKPAGDLIKLLRDAGYFDDLAEADQAAFCKMTMLALPNMRNKLGGHGQGKEIVDLPAPYGRLAVHLSAAFNHFLLELALERGEFVDEKPPEVSEDFVPVAEQTAQYDDDIPF